MMNGSSIAIRLDGDRRTYEPGETLSGEYSLLGVGRNGVKAAEVSVLWYTEGKGDEDLTVHQFWRFDADEGTADPGRDHRFETTLPASPLSYDGMILKIRWCVRVRVFPTNGKQIVEQKDFRLGNVPPAEDAEL